MLTFLEWIKTLDNVNESDTRYSVEVNFRTRTDEVLRSAAKITLGYVSAALKKSDFHVKQIFEDEQPRIYVSARHWDDGEWVCMVTWHPKERQYFISRGFFNKDRESVSVQSTHHVSSENAAELTNEVKNVMHNLKNLPDRHIQKLKRVALKRGPK